MNHCSIFAVTEYWYLDGAGGRGVEAGGSKQSLGMCVCVHTIMYVGSLLLSSPAVVDDYFVIRVQEHNVT